MVRSADGGSVLTEARAVDVAWPMFGKAVLAPDLPVAQALEQRDGVFGAVAEALLFTRLNLKPGDVVSVGEARFQLQAELVSEPDKLAGGVASAPRLYLGSGPARCRPPAARQLVRWSYRVTLPGDPAEADIAALIADAQGHVPEGGAGTCAAA